MAGAEVDVGISEDFKHMGLGEIAPDEVDAQESMAAMEMGEDSVVYDDALMDSDDVHDAAAMSKSLMESMKTSHFESQITASTKARKPTTKAGTKRGRSVPVWLPLTIPAIPKKVIYCGNPPVPSPTFICC
jgi:hypothetical protein